MASNGDQDTFPTQNVLQAMLTMRGGDSDRKKIALDYLGSFQKSKEAWSAAIAILQAPAEPDVQLFAATTLKGKITYDLSNQVSETDLPALRSQLLALLGQFAPGPKPVRIQLCVCLAILAIQMQSWKDVLPTVVSSLGNDVASHSCILDFLRVLPEEVTEGRNITLSEEELTERTKELLADNAEQVVQLLISYAQSSPAAATNPQLFECITSWLREVPIRTIVDSPLLSTVLNGVTHDQSLEAAADCLGMICRETSEVDDSLDVIQILLPKVVALSPQIQTVVESGDTTSYKALARLFADAGCAWVVLMAREPPTFRPLVEAILECAARDTDRDVIEYTFHFWYEFKQYLTMERYIQARLEFVDVYSKLVDIMMKHLQYPDADHGNDTDLFDGDREQEEKFREFRHHMGDTLKDACQVMGSAECLRKVLGAIQVWMQTYSSQATETSVPHWQALEAPLFSMRAMGRMVDRDETAVVPEIMPLLVRIPRHEKLQFAAIMVMGRYTEWTAAHEEFLEPQLKYIISAFETESMEVLRGAAQALKYICEDCKNLLGDKVVDLQSFYNEILDKLPTGSQDEVTEGVAHVVGAQPPSQIYSLLKLYCDPLFQRLMAKADTASQANDEKSKLILANHVQFITTFVQIVVVGSQAQENPAIKYWGEMFHILSTVLDNFIDFSPICERVCRCWRFMVISYRTDITPLLPTMANTLADGFARSRQGCFLWVTAAILREFSEDREHVDASITESIYVFFEQQATNVLRFVSDLDPADLPDVVEDFYRLVIDALLYYSPKILVSPLLDPMFQASISLLELEQREPLTAALHFLRDLLPYGAPDATGPGHEQGVTPEMRNVVKQLLLAHGEKLTKATMAGMMITFPRDCFADGSGVLLEMFSLLPAQTTTWVERTLHMLPAGTVTSVEAHKIMTKIRDKVQSADAANLRQVRVLLQDFTNTYRRRYVAPRDGLGQLAGTKFRFEG